MVAYLLAQGAWPDRCEPENRFTTLHLAAQGGSGADGSSWFQRRPAVSHRALSPGDCGWRSGAGRAKIAALLVQHGADVNLPVADPERLAPLHLAAATSRVRHRTDVSVRQVKAGDTDAGAIRQSDIVAILVAHGANLEQRDSRGRSALQIAAAHNRVGNVLLLLERGSDANWQSNNGMLVHRGSRGSNQRL